MRESRPKCPLCRAEFHYKHVDLAVPFRCPVCGQWLCVAHSYWYSVSGMATAMVVSGSFVTDSEHEVPTCAFTRSLSGFRSSSLLSVGKCITRHRLLSLPVHH